MALNQVVDHPRQQENLDTIHQHARLQKSLDANRNSRSCSGIEKIKLGN